MPTLINSMLIARVMFVLFVLAAGVRVTAAVPAEAPNSDEQLSREILGAWDWKKRVTYFSDGTWMLQKYGGDVAAAGIFRWSIHDGRLILRRDKYRFIMTIKSLSATELVLQAEEGQPEVDVRGVEGSLPFPQVIRNGRIFPPDPKVVEGALDAVYNTLRTKLGPLARQKLERDQLGWLITRETRKTNADPRLIKWSIEDLTDFTVERVMDLRRQLERFSN
jgi:hypothetical protein